MKRKQIIFSLLALSPFECDNIFLGGWAQGSSSLNIYSNISPVFGGIAKSKNSKLFRHIIWLATIWNI
jgi:hypothetical protein